MFSASATAVGGAIGGSESAFFLAAEGVADDSGFFGLALIIKEEVNIYIKLK